MKTALLTVILLAFLPLQPYNTSAQPTTEPSVCEYQETRGEKTPINPKTNKPYTPDERNEEPFDPDLSRPIDVKTLVTCLFREREIINHHVAFKDLVTAWRAAVLLKAIESLRARGIEKPSGVEIKKAQMWDLPIKLRDGVLHAANGIHLGVFSDPRVNSVDDLELDMRDALKLNRDTERLHIVRPTIIWRGMTIDARVGAFRNEGNPLLILDGGIIFDEATFRKAIVFYGVTLSKRRLVSFDKAKFHKRADFHKVTFTFARFNEATFSDEADFHESRLHKVDFENFANGIDFFGATFSKKVSFNRARFDSRVSFRNATFRENADFTQATFTRGSFLGATFDKQADFQFTRFSKHAGFSGVTFGEYAVFFHAKFHDQASFSSATFEKTTFSKATFDKQADFRWTRFKDSASFVKSIFTTVIFDSAHVNVLLDLREAVVSNILVFDKITSKGRIDLRGSQLAAWHWDSSDLPSQVVGIVDARSLRAGNLTLRSIYFQEIVDFSGMVIGLFAAPLEHYTPVFEIISLDFLDPLTNSIEVTDSRAITQIENVTFAQDVDFLHTTFYGPVRFNRNRFRATLDLASPDKSTT